VPRPTRMGLFMQPVHEPRENPTLALERDLQLIEHLDALGFDEVWIGEHHSSGWETVASPDIFIATAAARTRHIRLGSGVVPLSLHHPLLVADNYVLLDHRAGQRQNRRVRAARGGVAAAALQLPAHAAGARHRHEPGDVGAHRALRDALAGGRGA
jgi:alkanesulfonate monooxygenase SsuD/methylene tetrahydromethanopterin reductase-like flavin-dependent oxidoreductase (luciferase family)